MKDLENTCDFCDSDVPVLPYEQTNPNKTVMLCDVCASTSAGNACFYPTIYDIRLQETLRAISVTTNMILKELRK